MSTLIKSLIIAATAILTACGGGSHDLVKPDVGAAVAVCYRDADDGCDGLADGRFAHAWSVMPVGAVVASDSGELAYVARVAAIGTRAVWIQVR